MTKTPAVRKLLAGFLLLACSVTQASAQTKWTPADMLDPRLGPKHDDVVLSTPAPDELKTCTVESVRGAAPNTGGYVLKDAKGATLRRYFDSAGRGKVDTWSYYKDGVEVYREFDTAGKGVPNNFRWLNAGGMKWGVGGADAKTGKLVIHSWRMISAEEVAFEAFQAVAKNDPTRLQALLITEADMQMIKLPAAKIKAVAAIQQQAGQKFANLLQTVKLGKFDGVEGAVPQCDPNGDVDTIKFPSRAIRYEVTNGKNEKVHGWIHTGEMIQVGMAWRIIDVPSDRDPGATGDASPKVANKQLDKALNDLAEHDKKGEGLPTPRIDEGNKQVEAYYAVRIELVQRIIPLDKESEHESWYKQIFDNLTAQAQNTCDKTTIATLTKMKDDVVSARPGSNLAGYGTYREMWTRYAVGMAQAKETPIIQKLQERWLDDLTDFVKKYSKADDTPDALSQLAIGCEFAGKIEEAKRWYKELSTSFPNHYHAPRAAGSLARLELVGRPLTLTAPLLNDSSKMFNMADLKGKVVIVQYWSRQATTHEDDFARLKRIMEQVGTKNNVALVTISLDDDAGTAKAAISKAQIPGIHLFHATNNEKGMNSPPAIQYGIHILPTLFMVGRDGRVTSNSLQIGDIETELKKVQ